MRLLNGELLWLLPLVAVPLLIHILIRQRLPRIQWAAMSFLMRALRKNRRRLVLETILLLIVRTAIVAAVVMVVLRPVARTGRRWLSGERQPAVSIIVLDDSATMAASDGVRSRLDRAVSRIEQYLDELPAGSDVAMILAADPPIDVIRQPTRDPGYVRQALSKLTARDSAPAIARSMLLATERLKGEPTPNREIVLITDGRAASWQNDDARLQQAFAQARSTAAVLVLTVPETPAADVAITELSIAGGPDSLIPSLPCSLWPTAISVKLASFHQRETVNTAVDLFVDGQKIGRQQVKVPPDRPLIAAFEHRFNSPGEHTISARCDADLYERNNGRSMVVRVREQISVLLVDGRPGPDPTTSAGGFLQVALWPTDPKEPDSISLFDIRAVPTSALESVQISSFPLIILADVPALPTAALGQIKTAVRDGASLLIIAGPQTNASNLATMFAEGGSGLLPVQLAPPIDVSPDAQPVGLVLTEPLAPALAGFEDPTLTRALSLVGFRTLRPVAGVQGKNVQTWARFTQGGAALVANSYGRGRVVYLGAPADRQGGEFPLSPAFVPFFQQLAFSLTFGQDVTAIDAGRPIEWQASPAGTTTLTWPDGTSTPADTMISEDPGTGQRRVLLSSADRAGIYTLSFNDTNGSPRQVRKAANLPDIECDPVMLSLAELRPREYLEAINIVGPEESVRAAIRTARPEVELSTVGIGVLIALLTTELLLVKWFAPRQADAEAMLRKAMRL